MRLKKVKGADEALNNSEYVINNFDILKGNTNKIFNNNNPVHLEIGMGKGDFIIGMAKQFPNINFIGLEKYTSVQIKALEKLENEKLQNVRLISYDALKLNDIFEKEIDTIYLNFSDPWPKKRHAARRLTHESFLKIYENIFIGSPHIIQKTDNTNLFEFSVKSLTDYGYKLEYISLDLYSTDLTLNVPTEYEKKFQKSGSLIYKAEYIKDNK